MNYKDHFNLADGCTNNCFGKFKIGGKYIIKGKSYQPSVDLDYTEEGFASWYGGTLFHNKTTANGATYDQNSYVVAHRTLHMPSVVRVTNLSNGRAVKAVVMDRGPYNNTEGKKRRIVDVSRKIAQDLGFFKQGTAKVRVEYLHYDTLKLLELLPENDRKKAMLAFKNSSSFSKSRLF